MTDEEKKAVETLKHWIEYEKANKEIINKVDELIFMQESILNLIEKQQKEIKNLKFKNEVYKKKAKIDEKVIDEMAEKINQAYFDENNMSIWFEENILPKNKDGEYDLKDLGTRKNHIKQYFIRKVENENV